MNNNHIETTRTRADTSKIDSLLAAMPSAQALVSGSIHPLSVPAAIAKAGLDYAMTQHYAAERERGNADLSIARIQTVQQQLAAQREERWDAVANRHLTPAEMGEASALLLRGQRSATRATVLSFLGNSA